MKRSSLCFLLIIALCFPVTVANAEGEVQIRLVAEYVGGYDRSLFKHWIDDDKNGCDTRKEVLIKQAIVKPKKGAKCKLTGGKWISAYDGKSYTADAGQENSWASAYCECSN
jgi:hypothetical protein